MPPLPAKSTAGLAWNGGSGSGTKEWTECSEYLGAATGEWRRENEEKVKWASWAKGPVRFLGRGFQVDLSSQMIPNQWKKTYCCLGYIGDGILHSYMIYGDYNRPIISSLDKQLRENLHLTRFFWLWTFLEGLFVTFSRVLSDRHLGDQKVTWKKLVQSTTQKFNIPKMDIFKRRNMFQTKINWKLRSTDI